MLCFCCCCWELFFSLANEITHWCVVHRTNSNRTNERMYAEMCGWLKTLDAAAAAADAVVVKRNKTHVHRVQRMSFCIFIIGSFCASHCEPFNINKRWRPEMRKKKNSFSFHSFTKHFSSYLFFFYFVLFSCDTENKSLKIDYSFFYRNLISANSLLDSQFLFSSVFSTLSTRNQKRNGRISFREDQKKNDHERTL